MKKNFKKILSFILAISMAIPSVQLPVYATEADGYEVETVADDLTGDTTENKDTVVTEVVEKHIEGTITADTTWNDGDIIGDVTISGGTVENPIQITVNGTVTVMGQITLDKNAAAYVVFEGTGTLVSEAVGSKALIWTEGNNFRHNLTIKGITLDGGAKWSGDNYQTLKRGTTNQGRTASGNGAILFVRYTDVFIEDAIIQNQYGSQAKCAAVNLGYATMNVTDSIICNNYHTGDRGGAVYMRNGAKFVAENTIFNGNHGDTGGVIGTSGNDSYDSIVIVKDCEFYDNYATTAGAVFCNQDNTQNGIGELTIKKCEFYNNGSPKSLIYNHAYSFMPTTIVDSYFHDNACSFYDYSNRNENVFVSGDTIIETDAWSSYDYGVPLVINGALGEKAKIEIDAASAEHLLNNGGCVVSVADDYTITEEDLKKISIDGYEKFVLVDVNGDNRYDLVPVTEEVQAVEVTLKDSLDSTAEEKQIVYKEIASLPVCKFGHKGLVFAGWKDENGNAVAKQKFTESVTLTATWKIETPTVKLSRDVATLKATVTNSYDNVDYSYQWYVDDVAIDGATESTYTMTDVNSHSYKCVVTASVDGLDDVTGSASGTSSAPASAQIGDAKFATLAEAIAVAEDGATVTVLCDQEIADTIVVDKTITLDLNGKIISQSKECTGSYEMINNKGNLTITGNGKISFTDTSAGDPTFGWGSYTIRNEGTLVVENGTIEHLGKQNTAGNVVHMYCAIFQYDGSTTINGGKISTPTYRSVRLWKGDMTINDGTFDGQVWVQAVDNTANLVVNGGSFEPNGNDGSSVFVENAKYDVEFAVSGGTFNTKIGCSDAAKLAGSIAGGTYTEAAVNATNEALLAEGYVFEKNDNGTYGVVDEKELNKEYVLLIQEQLLAGNDVTLDRDIVVDGSYIISVNAPTNGNGKYMNPGIFCVVGGYGDGKATFDLNGHSITYNGHAKYTWNDTEYSSCKVAHGLFFANNGGELTIVDSKETAKVMVYGLASAAYPCSPNSKIMIEGGTWKNEGCAEGCGTNLFLYASHGGELYVNGGSFEQAKDAEGNYYLIVEHGGEVKNDVIDYSKTKIVISGGTFIGQSPDEAVTLYQKTSGGYDESKDNVCEAGFAPETIDGVSTVKVGVATVNGKVYETFKDAVTAANAIDGGATIKLFDNVTVSEKLTIKKNITITGKYTITRGIAGTIFVVDKNATLTLDGGVVIDGGNNWTFDSENFYADLEAAKTLTTGAKDSYSTSAEGGIVSTAAMISISGTKGAVVMNNATIQNNWGSQLFSVPAGATLTMNEGTLISHIRGSVAGQLSGTWVMNGGKITGVHGHNTNGGLVDLRNSGKWTINGGEICYVTVLGLNANGNGIVAQVYGNSSKLTINDANIHDNAAFSPGGGWGSVVYLNRGGDFEMNGGTITTTASDHCTAFVSNTSTSIVLNAGIINVEESTGARFDSLIYGDITIGENMKLTGGGLSIVLCDAGNKFENNGTIDCDIQLCAAEVTGNGTFNGDVTIKVDDYFEFDGKAVISGGTWNGTFTVEEGATLSITGGVFKEDPTPYAAENFKVTKLADGTFGIEEIPVHEVSTKAELDAAIKKAVAGDIVKLTANIDYGTDQLAIDKEITLDLGGNVLTTNNAYGGMSLKGNCTVKNGTISHKAATAAIKAWNVASFENLVIDVAFVAENKTIGGIVVQSGNTVHVGTIKNVTIKGEGLTNGIETYNCGEAEEVIGSMENVTIDAKSTGLLISAPCGTAANCDIKGGVSGIELWIKGKYSATLDLVECTVEGGTQAIYVHDEFSSNPNVVNNGKLEITIDDATEIKGNPLTQTIARAEDVHVDEAIIENAVAKANDTYFNSFKNAIAAANEAESATITLLEDVTSNTSFNVTGKVTLDLNGKKITGTDNSTASFALINVQPGADFTVEGTGTITLKATNDRDWNAYSSVISNQRGTLTVNGGTIKHLGGTDMAYAIDNLTNGKGTKAVTVINDGNIISPYRAIRQFLNGVEADNTLTINGGTIIGANKSVWVQDPSAYANSGTLTISENAELYGDVYLYANPNSTEWPVEVAVAKAAFMSGKVVSGNLPAGYALVETSGVYGVVTGVVAMVGEVPYTSLAEAFAAADGKTVTLVTDVEVTDTIKVTGTVTLDLNGKTISQEKACTASYSMIENEGNLTITGNGKISFKDTGAGDPNFGWGSYTLTNRGTLVVENGTIENLSEQNPGNGQSNVHMYCAIQQSAGTTTINGGTISNNTYRSVRVNRGEFVINGGEFVGQVWVQPFDDSTALTIKGGSFKPTGNDGSSVYVENSAKEVAFAVSGGKFATKIGVANAENLAGSITGGQFSKAAKADTNTTLLKEGFVFGELNAEGYCGIAEAGVLVVHEVNGNKYFASIYDALDYINPREAVTIKLLSDVTITADQRMFSNYSIVINAEYITLDLNGKTMTFDYEGSNSTVYAAFALYNGAKLTITDTSEEQTGTIYNKTKIQGTDGPRIIWITSAGSATILAGNFISEQGDTMFYTSNSNPDIPTTLYIKGGYFEHVNPTSGETYRYFNQQNGYQKQIIEVSGGTFAHNPTDSEMTFPEGCEAGQNENGTWGVVEIKVAQIGDTTYPSLAKAIEAANAMTDGATVTLLEDTTVDEAIKVTGNVTLDLNGYTITGTPATAAGYSVIENKGNLTITGAGAIVCDHKLEGSTAYAVNTITNAGTLVIDGPTIENNSTATNQIGYAIDNNSTTADAIVVVEAGEVKASGSNYYDAIRQFCNSATNENSVTVEGGKVSSIWMQNPSDGSTDKNTKDVAGSVTITGGEVTGLYLEPSTNFEAAITGGIIGEVEYFQEADGRNLTGFISGGTFKSDFLEELCADGYKKVDNGDGTYGVEKDSTVTPEPTPGPTVAKIGDAEYDDVNKALAAAQSGDTVVLVANIPMTDGLVIKKGIVLDLAGYTLETEYVATFKGAYIVDSSTSKTGLLKVNPDMVSLAEVDEANNGYKESTKEYLGYNNGLPVWNGKDGFVFAKVNIRNIDQYAVKESSADGFSLSLRPSLGSALNKPLLADGAADNMISIIIEVSWTDKSGNDVSQRFVYPENLIKEVYGNSQNFTFKCSGLSTLSAAGSISARIIVESDLGVMASSDVIIP